MSPKRFCSVFEAILRGGEIDMLRLFDQRADPVDALPAIEQRAADRFDHVVDALERMVRVSIGWRPAGFLAQFGNVHVAEIGQHQRARDRRRAGHHQHVDRRSPLFTSARR